MIRILTTAFTGSIGVFINLLSHFATERLPISHIRKPCLSRITAILSFTAHFRVDVFRGSSIAHWQSKVISIAVSLAISLVLLTAPVITVEHLTFSCSVVMLRVWMVL